MGFNEREQALIELMADLTDKRTKEEKSKAVGYSEKAVYRLQRKPEFREAVMQLVRDNLGLDLAKVLGTLVDAATNGDTKAAELILKAAGIIASGNTQTNVVNMRQSEPEETLADRFDRVREQRAADLAKWQDPNETDKL